MSVPNPPLIGYRNLLREATLSTAEGDPAKAVDWRLDRAWQPGLTTAVLEAVLPDPEPADYVAIIGHNLGRGSLTLRAWDGAAFVDVAMVAPAGSECRMATFPTISSDRWQLTATTAGDPVVIAAMAVGDALALDSGLRQGFVPPPFTRQAEVLATTSQDGIPLGRSIRRQPGRLTINATELDEHWMRREWLPFREHALRHPFFLLWNPDEFPDEAGLCWSEEAPGGNAYTQPGFMDGTLRCRVLTEVDG